MSKKITVVLRIRHPLRAQAVLSRPDALSCFRLRPCRYGRSRFATRHCPARPVDRWRHFSGESACTSPPFKRIYRGGGRCPQNWSGPLRVYGPSGRRQPPLVSKTSAKTIRRWSDPGSATAPKPNSAESGHRPSTTWKRKVWIEPLFVEDKMWHGACAASGRERCERSTPKP